MAYIESGDVWFITIMGESVEWKDFWSAVAIKCNKHYYRLDYLYRV